MSSLFKSLRQQYNKSRWGNQNSTQAKDADYLMKIDKNAVLQEAKSFNDKVLNTKQARDILAKLVYLYNQGEEFTENESTSLFFGITKLFSSNNFDLRKMIYLIIKELGKQEMIYIMTQSVCKDMISKNDLFRMNALRTIPLIITSEYIGQNERYIKNAINDNVDSVASAGLLASFQLLPTGYDQVKKWSNLILESLQRRQDPNTQYHALVLMHELKKNDQMSFIKILLRLIDSTKARSLLAVQMIRFVKEIYKTHEYLDKSTEQTFQGFLNKMLHSKEEFVIIEAAKTYCELNQLSNKEIKPAVTSLLLFIANKDSTNSITQYAALKILNKLISNPIRLSLLTYTKDLESMLNDKSKNLASIAVSILLKVCKQNEIQKLLNKIYDFVNDIPDEFKVDIIRSVKLLIKRAPGKFKLLVNFLANCLKSNDGNFEFKREAIEALQLIMEEVPESQTICLNQMAEYIEDCPHVALHIKILNTFVKEAPLLQNPESLIRFISNRMFLEDTEVRAAAISTLGTIAMNFKNLKQQIRKILTCALDDENEQVKERAYYYIDMLSEKSQEEVKLTEALSKPLTFHDIDCIEAYIGNLESQMDQIKDPTLLNMNNIKKFAEDNEQIIQLRQKQEQEEKEEENINVDNQREKLKEMSKKSDQLVEEYNDQYEEDELFNKCGELRKVLGPFALTGEDAEYQVKYNKLFFAGCMIFEVKITNSLENTTLKNVRCDFKFQDTQDLKIPNSMAQSIDEIGPQQNGSLLVVVAMNPSKKVVGVHGEAFLNFIIAEEGSNEYEDEYQLEDFELELSDFMNPYELPNQSYQSEWLSIEGDEQQEMYQINYKNIESAIKGLKEFFGMSVCENSDQIDMSKPYHTLYLSGLYINVIPVLLICQIGFDKTQGCVAKLRGKSSNEQLTENIVNSLQ